MLLGHIELLGKKVKLVPLEEHHTKELYRAGLNEEVWTYLPKKVHALQDMENIVEEAIRARQEGIAYPFVVIDREKERVVGSTRFLNISLPNKNLEIGWTWYDRDVWRTRVNTETKYLLLKYCFEDLKMIRVQLQADNRNERSKKAIQRIGAQSEGIMRKNRIMEDGFVRDSAIFSIIDSEWEKVREQLEKKLEIF